MANHPCPFSPVYSSEFHLNEAFVSFILFQVKIENHLSHQKLHTARWAEVFNRFYSVKASQALQKRTRNAGTPSVVAGRVITWYERLFNFCAASLNEDFFKFYGFFMVLLLQVFTVASDRRLPKSALIAVSTFLNFAGVRTVTGWPLIPPIALEWLSTS